MSRLENVNDVSNDVNLELCKPPEQGFLELAKERPIARGILHVHDKLQQLVFVTFAPMHPNTAHGTGLKRQAAKFGDQFSSRLLKTTLRLRAGRRCALAVEASRNAFSA